MRRLLTIALLAGASRPASAQAGPFGRWDLTIHEGAITWPMWLELSAGPPVSGRLQGRTGHALPLEDLELAGTKVRFTLPSEQPRPDQPRFEAAVAGNSMVGALVMPSGSRLQVTGRRAPALERSEPPAWGAEMDLLASGLERWTARDPTHNGWRIDNGELVNEPPSSDLITKDRFTDFKLHLEVNVPPEGNSGIYLRGRHEVQVQDDHGREPGSRRMGGIYGQVTPTALPAKPAGEWQAFDITLVGRRVTVVLNGVTILENVEIPGITGGALDSNEAEPGPLMLQGDHSAIRYRNIRITPARSP
jgi:Domain of Unknown Function (DUF1080)